MPKFDKNLRPQSKEEKKAFLQRLEKQRERKMAVDESTESLQPVPMPEAPEDEAQQFVLPNIDEKAIEDMPTQEAATQKRGVFTVYTNSDVSPVGQRTEELATAKSTTTLRVVRQEPSEGDIPTNKQKTWDQYNAEEKKSYFDRVAAQGVTQSREDAVTRPLQQTETFTQTSNEIPSKNIEKLEESDIPTERRRVINPDQAQTNGVFDQTTSEVPVATQLRRAVDTFNQITEEITVNTPTQIIDLDQTQDYLQPTLQDPAIQMRETLNSEKNPNYSEMVQQFKRNENWRQAALQAGGPISKERGTGGFSTFKEPVVKEEDTAEIPVPGDLEANLSRTDITAVESHIGDRLQDVRRANGRQEGFARAVGNEAVHWLERHEHLLAAETERRLGEAVRREQEFKARKKVQGNALTLRTPERDPQAFPNATERYVLNHLLETADTTEAVGEARAVLFEMNNLLDTRSSNVADVLSEPVPGTDGTVYDRCADRVRTLQERFTQDEYILKLAGQVQEKLAKIRPVQEGAMASENAPKEGSSAA